MLYYNDDLDNEPEVITAEEFEEIFGEEWVCGYHEFIHCTIDPFYEEIWSSTRPLWAYSLEELRSKRFDRWQEI